MTHAWFCNCPECIKKRVEKDKWCFIHDMIRDENGCAGCHADDCVSIWGESPESFSESLESKGTQ